MAKELTLEELAKSNNTARKVNKSMPNEPKKAPAAEGDAAAAPFIGGAAQSEERPAPTNKPKPAKLGAAMSTRDFASTLRQDHADEIHEENEITPPIVENAFADMRRTIQERKDNYENKFIPALKQAVEEDRLNKELGEDPDSEDDDEAAAAGLNPALDEDFSDLDDLDDDEDEAPKAKRRSNEQVVETAPEIEEDFNYENSSGVVTEDDNEVAVEEEAPKPKKTRTVAKPVRSEDEADDDTSSDLDNLLGDLDSEDDDEIVDEESDGETNEEMRERFKDTLKSIKVIKDPIDLSKFTIRKEPVSSASILNDLETNQNTLAKVDWGLYYTKRSVTFQECKGPELDALRRTIDGSNPVNSVIATLRFVYNHIVDINKPKFEEWTKLIRTEDIESLYFGMYRACYADSNLVPRACSSKGCEKTSIIDTPIDDMVKFSDDKVKEEFYNILKQDSTTPTKKFKSTLMQISDKFVVSYSEPTLYSTFIQYASLKPEITQKYSDYLNTMAYINGFYIIDESSNNLIPVSIKEYPHNFNKTILTKLKTYVNILKTLSNDQYNVMITKLSNIIEDPKVTYIYPKTTCPECGADIAEESVDSVIQLLFTRAQLVQIKGL